jgi:hypothetical protein
MVVPSFCAHEVESETKGLDEGMVLGRIDISKFDSSFHFQKLRTIYLPLGILVVSSSQGERNTQHNTLSIREAFCMS